MSSNYLPPDYELPTPVRDIHPTLARRLTRQQAAIVELLICGTSPTNREIAKKLGVEVSTLKTQLARLMRAVGADNRTHLALLAIEGIDEPDRRADRGREAHPTPEDDAVRSAAAQRGTAARAVARHSARTDRRRDPRMAGRTA